MCQRSSTIYITLTGCEFGFIIRKHHTMSPEIFISVNMYMYEGQSEITEPYLITLKSSKIDKY